MKEIRRIKKKTFEGILWRGGYRTFQQISVLIVKIVLVRLLLPDDFGLIAMALIVFDSLDIINRFVGIEPFIRDNESDYKNSQNTLFYLTAIFSGTSGLLTFLSAPSVALFFSNKISNTQSITTLIWIIRLFSLKLFLCIPAHVAVAILTKELRFKEMYICNIAGTFSYVVAAPILAFLGFGVWAIALGLLLEQIVITIFYLYYVPFVPALSFNKQIAKNYIKYNSNIFIISIVTVVITQGDDTIIGRLMGTSILGFYNIGQQFAMLVISVISANINIIIFPVFSKVQNDREIFTRVYIKSFRLISLLAIPFIGGSVILAKEIVLCFLGEKWLPMLPAFYILSISSLLTIIISTANPVFMSLNKPYLIRNNRFIQLAFFILLIYPFAKAWGYMGVCWVMVILSIIPLIYLIPKLAKEIDELYSYMFNVLSKSCLCTFFMLVGISSFKKIIQTNIVWLSVSVILGIFLYIVPMLFYDKELINDIREGLIILKEKVRFTTA